MSNPNPISFDWNLEPKDNIKYLQNKGFKLSFNYDELMHQTHHQYFTVAKVTRLDLLKDIFDSLIQAEKEGMGFDEWKRNLKPNLQKQGWWGQISVVNPVTGETKNINVNARRLDNIAMTNMRVANATSRYKKQKTYKTKVYWRYVAILDGRARPTHRAMHGIVKHRDDSFWDKNYPPNGWRCRCFVQAYSKQELERNGWSVHKGDIKNIADEDWAYSMDDTRVSKISKIDLDKSLKALPLILPNRDYKELSHDELKQKFYDDLGVKEGDLYIDKVGDPMVIGDELFKAVLSSKITKKYRHLFIDEFANTISDPDEIYLEVEALRNEDDKYIKKSTRLIKKFFKYFIDEKGKKRALVAMFEYLKDKTQGVSLYFIETDKGVEKRRMQKLIWQKELK